MAIIDILTVHKIRDFYAAAAHEKSQAIQHYFDAYQSLGSDFVDSNLDALTAVYDKMVESLKEENKKVRVIDSYISIRNTVPAVPGILRTISADRSEEIKKQFSAILDECQERCPEIFKEEA